MAKKAAAKTRVRTTAKRPRATALPGMEDHAIKPLEDVATEYAEIRDARMELTEREHAAKGLALKLMKKYDKTIYRHNGVEITVVPGEDDVKVRVKKAGDDDESGDDVRITQTEERRQAVDED